MRLFLLLFFFTACGRLFAQPQIHYYHLEDDLGAAFTVHTDDPALIAAVDYQMSLPLQQRSPVSGYVAAGPGPYMVNYPHDWHFFDWSFAASCQPPAAVTIPTIDNYFGDTAHAGDTMSYCVTNARVVSSSDSCAGIYGYFNFFPNPFRNRVGWAVCSRTPYHATIYDLRGRLVWEMKDIAAAYFHPDLSALAVGIYILRIETDGRTIVHKLAKE